MTLLIIDLELPSNLQGYKNLEIKLISIVSAPGMNTLLKTDNWGGSLGVQRTDCRLFLLFLVISELREVRGVR